MLQFVAAIDGRQALGGLQVALARGVHGRADHLREQVEADRRHVARLLGAHQAAGAADLKVAHGDAHTASQVGMLVQRRQTRLRLLGEVDVFGEHEERIRLGGATAHTALQLIHLSQAQTLRILDDERVGVRVVDAGLDDGGCDQHIKLSGGKLLHYLLQRVLVHLPVRHAHARLPGCGTRRTASSMDLTRLET